jgi:phosphoribosylglycinamide formyltransferase-1
MRRSCPAASRRQLRAGRYRGGASPRQNHRLDRGALLSARLVVLVSGTGSILQALLDASRDPAYGADVVAVGADRQGIEGLARAEAAGLPTFVVRVEDHPHRASWNDALEEAIGSFEPDLVVFAGFMKVVGPAVVDAFPIVNTHPALLPAFPGAHAVRDALHYGARVTGCTVHLVDLGVDSGPVLAQEAVEVRDDDDEATLHDRIKDVERRLVVDVVGRMARNGWKVSGRKVLIP